MVRISSPEDFTKPVRRSNAKSSTRGMSRMSGGKLYIRERGSWTQCTPGLAFCSASAHVSQKQNQTAYLNSTLSSPCASFAIGLCSDGLLRSERAPKRQPLFPLLRSASLLVPLSTLPALACT
jgi:hypothetical protein